MGCCRFRLISEVSDVSIDISGLEDASELGLTDGLDKIVGSGMALLAYRECRK
jgi:hypothetical protein